MHQCITSQINGAVRKLMCSNSSVVYLALNMRIQTSNLMGLKVGDRKVGSGPVI